MVKLVGRMALVTGSGRGMGQQVALQLAAKGAGGVMLFCLPESDYVSGQLLEITGGY